VPNKATVHQLVANKILGRRKCLRQETSMASGSVDRRGIADFSIMELRPILRTQLVYFESSLVRRIVAYDLWPPRSPDFITSAFFITRFLKETVYSNNPQSLEELNTVLYRLLPKLAHKHFAKSC